MAFVDYLVTRTPSFHKVRTALWMVALTPAAREYVTDVLMGRDRWDRPLAQASAHEVT